MARLSVNVDHIATLRQARGTDEPDPVWAAVLAEKAGADGIIVHLREDRRHIQDRDLTILRQVVKGKFNQEMAATEEMIQIARQPGPGHLHPGARAPPGAHHRGRAGGGRQPGGHQGGHRPLKRSEHFGEPVHRPGGRAGQGRPHGRGPDRGAAHRGLCQRQGRCGGGQAFGRLGRRGPAWPPAWDSRWRPGTA